MERLWIGSPGVQARDFDTKTQSETIRYYGRDGTAELFNELIDSKKGNPVFNGSLTGHPGAGTSNLVRAVSHHVVTTDQVTVLWASCRDVSEKWELRLFERDTSAGAAKV